MKSNTQSYHSYLLRLWYDPKTSRWRIVIENVHTGEKQGFIEVESLLTYIKEQCLESA